MNLFQSSIYKAGLALFSIITATIIVTIIVTATLGSGDAVARDRGDRSDRGGLSPEAREFIETLSRDERREYRALSRRERRAFIEERMGSQRKDTRTRAGADRPAGLDLFAIYALAGDVAAADRRECVLPHRAAVGFAFPQPIARRPKARESAVYESRRLVCATRHKTHLAVCLRVIPAGGPRADLSVKQITNSHYSCGLRSPALNSAIHFCRCGSIRSSGRIT
jgi:hypothetical protein